ncbi:F0F1 ATP synthase subunit gamma [Aestuariimicrobium ganziense]|uniref:F0F1 ATP synthase subunit gamma n=1 Tax=Aestuariimicrobium ganziense TaxID=2773677 RepID=UPI0019449C88|nr:F0F1 ATP synthase subunit gamma [Aestuariimicrobium ganziense]
MASSLRELRQRRNSVRATQKITRAMELIAASRIIKADRAARAALPFTSELNRAVAALATYSTIEHPLTTEPEKVRRAAVVVVTSDRGLAGAYSSNAIRTALRLTERLTAEGVEVKRYVVGRKGINYFRFRKVELADTWDGFSDSPAYANAVDIADAVMADFMRPHDEGGVDEIYAVYTRMKSMLIQEPRVRRVLPIEVVEEGSDKVNELKPVEMPLQYEFEPDPETVLDTLMPLYVRNRFWFYLLESAASQLASQQRAMKSATDNAQTLIETLTREENQARQAEITQEISEIVGGASALTESAQAE